MFLPGVKYTINYAALSYRHISFGDCNQLSANIETVLTRTLKDSPCISAVKIQVNRDALAVPNVPSNDS
jgi:hypothetical protein